MTLTPTYPNEDYELFGKIILNWGHLESWLLNIVLRLTHPRFELKERQVPVLFSKRIKRAKLGFAEIPAMAPLKIEALSLLEHLEALSATRHIIVHGYYQGFSASGYMFGRFEQPRDGRQSSRKFHYIRADEIDALMSDIESTSKQLEQLSRKTFEIPFPTLNPKSSKAKKRKL